jgi:hypothetical protein
MSEDKKQEPVKPAGKPSNLTPEQEEQLKKKLEELRKRDPFVYR